MESPIIVALDGMNRERALEIAAELRGKVWGFKVHDLVLRAGMSIITELKQFGKVFVDFKFHDIPATVKKEVRALVEHGADLITVHASGGREMLRAAVAAGGNRIIAVTALTSLSDNDTKTIYQRNSQETVRELAMLAHDSGVQNIVCSPQEIAIVKEVAPGANIITPGIRGTHDPADDQNRTSTAKHALEAGSDLLVIGRPITKAPNPSSALEEILASIA